MIVLGVDTSGYSVSVALLRDGDVLGEYSAKSDDLRNAVMFQPLAASLMSTCRLKLSDIDLFAVTNGPGSFTGIRSGLAAVKAMAYAASVKATAVSSLRALARTAGEQDALVLPMFDARGGRVYASLYRNGVACFSDEPRPAGELAVLAASFVKPGERVLAAGDGLRVLESWCVSESGRRELPFVLRSASPERQMIRASAVAALALEDVLGGRAVTDPFLLDAHYAIASSAERMKSV